MRIGLIGTDSSHAADCLRLLNAEARYPGFTVGAIWGADPSTTQALAQACGVPKVDEPGQLLGLVDAVIIVERHGGEHLRVVLPFATAGVPALIDKPLACSLADAEAILLAYRRSGSLVMSASALRWQPDTESLRRRISELGGPRAIAATGLFDAESPYGGAFFYGIHAVELALQLSGPDIADINIDLSLPDRVVATCRVGKTAVEVRLIHPRDGEEVGFSADVECRSGTARQTIALGTDYMAPVLDRFIDMLATGRPPLSDAELLAPVQLMAAIQSAIAARWR